MLMMCGCEKHHNDDAECTCVCPEHKNFEAALKLSEKWYNEFSNIRSEIQKAVDYVYDRIPDFKHDENGDVLIELVDRLVAAGEHAPRIAKSFEDVRYGSWIVYYVVPEEECWDPYWEAAEWTGHVAEEASWEGFDWSLGHMFIISEPPLPEPKPEVVEIPKADFQFFVEYVESMHGAKPLDPLEARIGALVKSWRILNEWDRA